MSHPNIDEVVQIIPKELFKVMKPCGLRCECGSNNVYELQEVDTNDWQKVTGVFYMCADCEHSWTFRILGRGYGQ